MRNRVALRAGRAMLVSMKGVALAAVLSSMMPLSSSGSTVEEDLVGKAVTLHLRNGVKIKATISGISGSSLLLERKQPREVSGTVDEVPISIVEYVEDRGSFLGKSIGTAIGIPLGLVGVVLLAGPSDDGGSAATALVALGAGAVGGGIFGYHTGRALTRHRYLLATSSDGSIVSVRTRSDPNAYVPRISLSVNAGWLAKVYMDDPGQRLPSGGLSIGWYQPLRPGLTLVGEVNLGRISDSSWSEHGIYYWGPAGDSIIGTSKHESTGGRLYDAALLFRGEVWRRGRASGYLEAGYGVAYFTRTLRDSLTIGDVYHRESVTRDKNLYPACLLGGVGCQIPISRTLGVALRGQLAARMSGDPVFEPRISVGLTYGVGGR